MDTEYRLMADPGIPCTREMWCDMPGGHRGECRSAADHPYFADRCVHPRSRIVAGLRLCAVCDSRLPDAEPWTVAAERNAWSILAADPSFRAGMERARGEHERGEFAPFRHSHVYRWSEVKQAKASGRKPRCRLCAAEARNRTDDLAPARGILLGILLGLLAWAVIGAIWEATR